MPWSLFAGCEVAGGEALDGVQELAWGSLAGVAVA